jgi:NAD(P)-dependent dehydrogenase (short-subunit alcohol dehydrogenase family)
MTVWNDQVIIVTGGSRGIGYETARCLVAAGARVLLVARDPIATANAAATLSQKGPGEAHGLALTLTGCPEDGEAVCRAAFQQYGRITGLVNCAGGASVGTPLGLDWRRWQEDFTVKFWGYLSLMRAVVPYLRQVGGGAIVNVAGVTGKDPNPRLAAATTINGALRGLTKILADEVAPWQIRVVNVNPGATETALLLQMAEGYARLDQISPDQALTRMRQTPRGRLTRPEDIARLILFLLSDEAGMITGTSVDIDGGIHRGPA